MNRKASLRIFTLAVCSLQVASCQSSDGYKPVAPPYWTIHHQDGSGFFYSLSFKSDATHRLGSFKVRTTHPDHSVYVEGGALTEAERVQLEGLVHQDAIKALKSSFLATPDLPLDQLGHDHFHMDVWPLGCVDECHQVRGVVDRATNNPKATELGQFVVSFAKAHPGTKAVVSSAAVSTVPAAL